MRTILCYGDSNTWGYDPVQKCRLGKNERWGGVLRNQLGNDYWVIEEGLGGRTTVWDDPIEGEKNGKKYLIPCLESHKPLDLVILMLGTNDLKHRFSLTAFDIAKGAGTLVGMIQNSKCGLDNQAPQILLLAPPPVSKLTELKEMFKDAEEKSQKFGQYYQEIAKEFGSHFLDVSKFIVSSDMDGIHFDKNEHDKLGKAVAQKVLEIFSHN